MSFPAPDPVALSPLAQQLVARITADGAITVAEYMQLCLSHYYAAHKPFGVEGDFITAPEISQMFGEMIGAWMTDVWMQMGQPEHVQLIELGPGRGTLAADIMRTVSAWPAFKAAVTLHLVETSPQLRQIQAQNIKSCHPTWYDRLEEVPVGLSFIYANEFFDALPIHQFVREKDGWRERAVGWDAHKSAFMFTTLPADQQLIAAMPAACTSAPEGSVFELSPATLGVTQAIAKRIAEFGGAGLFIDYGHGVARLGDTLQAVRRHGYSAVLEEPGDKDLTAHVDFATMSIVAGENVHVHGPVTQAEFLTRLGIVQRAEALREDASDKQAKDIELALYRLIAPSEMGHLFKVIAFTPRDSTFLAAGFTDIDHAPEEEHPDEEN